MMPISYHIIQQLPLGRSAPVKLLQAGFSLVELMVAITIGLFVTLGLSQIFLGMYSTSQSQGGLALFQDNQRIATVMLMNSIELAGYYNNGTPPTTTTGATTLLPAATNSDGSSFTAGAGLVGTSGGASASDTINTYYQTGGSTNDGLINCQGGTSATAVTFINSFSINSAHQLVCAVSTNSGTPSTPLIIANNIQSMTILYGVFTHPNPGQPSTTDTYMDANAVTTGTYWNAVRSVQLTINFCTAALLNPNAVITYPCATTPWIQTINVMANA